MTSPEVAPYRRRRLARGLKRALDVVGASAGLVVTAPVLAVCALGVYRDLGAPVLFRQTRPGLDGRPFQLLKFRTMAPPPVGLSDAAALASDGDRLTAFGRRMRSWSLDELPSLVNVLRGDMSLVGPRPLLMKYLERYTPAQRRRHEMPPGITGWAQVNGRNARTWDDKFGFDLYYIDRWSLWLDAVILARTLGKVLRREGITAPGAATMPEFTGREVDHSVATRVG